MSKSASTTPARSLQGLIISGVLITGIGFGGFLTWAASVPLASAVIAEGVVKVGSERKRIQHLEGGLVKRILVREGEMVRAGQILVTLDQTFAESEYLLLSQQLNALQVREAALLAAQTGQDALSFPKHLLEQADPIMQSRMRETEALFELDRSTLKGKLAILEQQSLQLGDQIRGMRAEVLAGEEQLALIEEELASLETLLQRRMTGKARSLELKREAARARGEIASLNTAIAEARTKQSEIELEREQSRQEYRYEAANELRELRGDMETLVQRLAASTNVLERVSLAAPVDGVVVDLAIHNIGEVVRPGDTLMEIVPARDELVIDARIRPLDVDKVSGRQAARARLSGYRQHEMPELQGTLEFVSADALFDEQSGQYYFEARIVMDNGANPLWGEETVKPGMPAEVYILTGESTPLQYFAEPLLTAFDKAWREQ
ncbi:HlyD family type I secretion periplasmic adaptor subunit [Allohahella marinimesophila]|uniref:Membrane fusion protein (MFP) family protein n=1 Tax=Allohahella marinimesophila TaxID=1054972 RepID=A0ABP7NLL7_9GAMM